MSDVIGKAFRLFGVGRSNGPAKAPQVMERLNDQALVCEEGGYWHFIEDHWDSDNDKRMYRLEYKSTPDAQHAIAYCRHNPWSNGGNPMAGESAHDAHMARSGLLCLDRDAHTSIVERSPLDLETTVRRARYWCTAFSVLKETGEFPNH